MSEEKQGLFTKIFNNTIAPIIQDRVKFLGLLLVFVIIFGMLIFKETSFSDVIGNGEFTTKIQEANETEFKKIQDRLDSHDLEFKEIKEILMNGYKRDD